MKNFRTYDVAVEYYKLCMGLGLKGDARDQLNRAARSIALNLAEGRARATSKDQRKYFNIAMGSLRESQAVLDLESLKDSVAGQCADKLGAHLYQRIQNAQ